MFAVEWKLLDLHAVEREPQRVPNGPGLSWSIDFVVALPESARHNGIAFTNTVTATDRFTKQEHFMET